MFTPQRRVSQKLPDEIALPPHVRRLSGRAIGERGSGKTVLATWQIVLDIMGGMGSIVIDPLGTVSNFVLAQLRGEFARHLKNIIYVPVGGMMVEGETYVVPTPFLYNRGNDELHDQTQRVVELFKRLSPEQVNAPIQGMPAIERTTDYAGMLLSAMGNQLVPDAADLLRDPKRWETKITAALEAYPWELREPAELMRLYADPRFRLSDKRAETLSFLNRIAGAVLSKRLAAQYGANSWGVDLTAVERGRTILFDCSGLKTKNERRVAVTWLFNCCLEYFRDRGQRRDTIGFVIDELSYFTDRENTSLEEAFEELIAQLSRNNGISCFFTYQQIAQPSPNMQRILSLVGYSLFGPTSHPPSALEMGRVLDEYDPNLAKTREPVYEREVTGDVLSHYRETIFTPSEQELLSAARQRRRPSGTFALTLTPKEGGSTMYVGEVSIRSLLAGFGYPGEFEEETKQDLATIFGRPVTSVMEEIEARYPTPPTEPLTEALAATPPPAGFRRRHIPGD